MKAGFSYQKKVAGVLNNGIRRTINVLFKIKKKRCPGTGNRMIENPEVGDFPGGTVVRNPPANAGDTGSGPGPGRFHMPRSN